MRHSIFVPLTFALVVAIAIGSDALVGDLVQNDASSRGDAGNSFHTVTILSNPSVAGSAEGEYYGLIVPAVDNEDWYGFFAPDATGISLTLWVHPLVCGPGIGEESVQIVRVQALIVDPAGNTRSEDDLRVPCPSADGHLSVYTDRPGIWRVAVRYTLEAPEGLLLQSSAPSGAGHAAALQGASAASPGAPSPPVTALAGGGSSAFYKITLNCEPACLS